jgi:integrase
VPAHGFSPEERDAFYCQFCYLGKRYTVTVGKVSPSEADAFAGSADLILLRLKQKLISLPPGVGIDEFILSGGKTPEQPVPVVERTSFATIKQKYLNTHRNGAMEANSLQTVEMHLNHVERTLGGKFPLQSLTLADLQRHVNRRREKSYRGKKLSPVTLRKEMATFRAAWNWATHMGMVKGPFPSRGVVYPKTDEKPPFMTWAEIERKLTPKLTDAERAELWKCLYLTMPEVEELLAFIKENAAHDWIYPVFCFACHTGARRSEMIRVLVSDVDFHSMTVVIREKKRSRKQRTTRRVPLTPHLAAVLKVWRADHPGGQYLFCYRGEVFRSKKRSATTGHRGEKTRPTSLKGRAAPVKTRAVRLAVGALTKDEVHDHFKRTLAGSKWAVVPGWHCFRHSFISLCASQGVDQRLLDEWVGHQTDEQRKRYRHLLPSVQQQAIRSVFAG